MNRINKTNTKTIQNEPSKIQSDRPRQSKDDPRAPKSGPRPPQDDPKAPQDPPKRAQDPPKTTQDPPRSPLGTVLAAILGPTDHKIENQSLQVNGRQGLGVDFASPNGSQNDPKTSPKRDKNQDEK